MFKEVLNYIEDYDKIIIFRHIDGDGDALGSQWAFYEYLKEKFPSKEIYAVGDETPGYRYIFKKPHTLKDEDFDNSLAIIVDTANRERISDQRYVRCKEIIKIDHHLPVDDYGIVNIVDEKRSSCAEIVADLLNVLENGKPLNKPVAENLYRGIISDTQGFSISSVSHKTFLSASYLLESDISPASLSQELREIDLISFKFQAYLMNQIQYMDEVIAYLIITQEEIKNAGLQVSEVKRFVNMMRNIRGIKVWVLFIEREDHTFSASLRSHDTDVNTTARHYNGGGHLFASGIKGLDKEGIYSVLEMLHDHIK